MQSFWKLKYTKLFYKEIYLLYRHTDKEEFFIHQLKYISETQKDNFKKIIGFNINLINNNIKITTLSQLKDKINFIIKMKPINYIIKKPKANKKGIENILNVKQNINLKLLNDLIKLQ